MVERMKLAALAAPWTKVFSPSLFETPGPQNCFLRTKAQLFPTTHFLLECLHSNNAASVRQISHNQRMTRWHLSCPDLRSDLPIRRSWIPCQREKAVELPARHVTWSAAVGLCGVRQKNLCGFVHNEACCWTQVGRSLFCLDLL